MSNVVRRIVVHSRKLEAPPKFLGNAGQLARMILATDPSGANASPEHGGTGFQDKFSGGDASLWGPSSSPVLAKRRRMVLAEVVLKLQFIHIRGLDCAMPRNGR